MCQFRFTRAEIRLLRIFRDEFHIPTTKTFHSHFAFAFRCREFRFTAELKRVEKVLVVVVGEHILVNKSFKQYWQLEFEEVLTSGKFDGKGAVSCAQDDPGTNLQSYPQLSHKLCTVFGTLTSRFAKIVAVASALSSLMQERIEPLTTQEKSEYFRSRKVLLDEKMRAGSQFLATKLEAICRFREYYNLSQRKSLGFNRGLVN